MNRIERFGKRLENYEIYFKIFALLVIPIAAIYISYEANQISSQQTELMKTKELPILQCDIEVIYDPQGIKDELIVSNFGQPLKELQQYEELIFFEVDYCGHKAYESITGMLPVPEYYNDSYRTNKPTGELIRFSCSIPEGNYQKFIQLRQEFWKFSIERKGYGSIDIIRYIEVYYKDIWGEIHREYYYVDENNKTIRR